MKDEMDARTTNKLYWLDFSNNRFSKKPLFKAHCKVLPVNMHDANNAMNKKKKDDVDKFVVNTMIKQTH